MGLIKLLPCRKQSSPALAWRRLPRNRLCQYLASRASVLGSTRC